MFFRTLFSGLVLMFSGLATAAPVINTLKDSSFFSTRSDTAINGYDSVTYFTQNRPVKGSDSFVFQWKDAKWKFSTQANLDLFRTSPEKYAPQYGGYCAYGVANGNLVKVDPEQFTVLDGKLYLNYDAAIQQAWKKDISGFNKLADSKFQALLAK